MSLLTIVEVVFGVVAAAIIAAIVLVKRPKQLKTDRFTASWQELQGLCKDKATWPEAITQADKLLDIALKKRKFKGKTMGSRLVAAQRLLSDNDDVWFAHNLAKKIIVNTEIALKESDVKDALVGFRQALKDIGALPSGDQKTD
jgi:hypothetical protein